jgi:death on curing protein
MPAENLEVVYLTIDEALEIGCVILGCGATEVLDVMRSRAALESALARPQSYAHYQGADLALQAAVLAHGIAETQPLLDGNKRLALLTFLGQNGIRLDIGDVELSDWIVGLSGDSDPEKLAASIRAHAVPAA